MDINELIENFSWLEDWEERYKYVIDLGRALPPMPSSLKTDKTKVKGCISQVWLVVHPDSKDSSKLSFLVDSDAFIVKGLAAILMVLYNHKSPNDILKVDATAIIEKLGLQQHLSPNRRNGLVSMVERIQKEAQKSLASTLL